MFSLSSQVPPSLRAAVARWLEAATRQAGHPTPARVMGESAALAQELLAFAAPIARLDAPERSAAALHEFARELEGLLERVRGALSALEQAQ